MASRRFIGFRSLAGAVFLLLLGSAALANEGVYLGDLTWIEAEKRMASTPVVILPFGAGVKEHGPHLPMNADAVLMQHLVDAAVRQRNVIAAPPVLYGWFPAFRDFPGTEIRDPHVFEQYIRAVGQSLIDSGAQRLLMLNTGIGKATGLPMSIAARELRAATGVPVMIVSWGDLETEATEALAEQREGGHADEIETSINLVLQPDLIDMSRAVTDYGNRPDRQHGGYVPGYLSRDPESPDYASHGIYGDATLATVEKGRAALDIMVTEWLGVIDEFSSRPLRREPD